MFCVRSSSCAAAEDVRCNVVDLFTVLLKYSHIRSCPVSSRIHNHTDVGRKLSDEFRGNIFIIYRRTWPYPRLGFGPFILSPRVSPKYNTVLEDHTDDRRTCRMGFRHLESTATSRQKKNKNKTTTYRTSTIGVNMWPTLKKNRSEKRRSVCFGAKNTVQIERSPKHVSTDKDPVISLLLSPPSPPPPPPNNEIRPNTTQSKNN